MQGQHDQSSHGGTGRQAAKTHITRVVENLQQAGWRATDWRVKKRNTGEEYDEVGVAKRGDSTKEAAKRLKEHDFKKRGGQDTWDGPVGVLAEVKFVSQKDATAILLNNLSSLPHQGYYGSYHRH